MEGGSPAQQLSTELWDTPLPGFETQLWQSETTSQSLCSASLTVTQVWQGLSLAVLLLPVTINKVNIDEGLKAVGGLTKCSANVNYHSHLLDTRMHEESRFTFKHQWSAPVRTGSGDPGEGARSTTMSLPLVWVRQDRWALSFLKLTVE